MVAIESWRHEQSNRARTYTFTSIPPVTATVNRSRYRADTRRPSHPVALALLVAILGAGCATPPPEPPAEPEPRADLSELPPQVRASVLLGEARLRSEPGVIRSAIKAVLELDPASADQLALAERLWNQLPAARRESQADRLLGARLAATQGDWQAAQERLGADDPGDPTRTPSVYRQRLSLQARILEYEQRWYQALETRLRLDPLLIMEPDGHAANQRRIWALLAALRPAQRERLSERQPDAAAWVSLFQRLRTAETPERARQAAGTWRERYPSHSANTLLPQLLPSHPLQAQAPGEILVLLPLTGDLAGPGSAILDGVTRAYYAAGAGNARLRVRDTGGEPPAAAALYRRGVAAGVDRIIGPLRRESVAEVAQSSRTRPTILLNRTDASGRDELSTLALDPEEDAWAVAERAARAGWDFPLVILPEGRFGDRVVRAYREALAARDQAPRDTTRIPAGAEDLNTIIGSALGIGQSRARIREVSRRTGLELEADPQVRADIDHLFVAGTASQVRRIVPHLHFHRASHLPMMATSHVYAGTPDADRDSDLNGIVFPDAPWLFRTTDPEGDDASPNTALPRFMALGMDALRLSLYEDAVRAAPHRRVAGAAGTWGLNPLSHEWIREPAWARFEEGVPRRLDRPSREF